MRFPAQQSAQLSIRPGSSGLLPDRQLLAARHKCLARRVPIFEPLAMPTLFSNTVCRRSQCLVTRRKGALNDGGGLHVTRVCKLTAV